jgi:DNA-directed RNA polymerase specialized sigma24 family protein
MNMTKPEESEGSTEHSRMPLLALPDPNLQHYGDGQLVALMAGQTQNAVRAMDAATELHRRHARLLMAWCLKYQKQNAIHDPEDLVSKTFCKAYEKSGSFRLPRDLTPDQEQRKVRSWLFCILNNCFLDSINTLEGEPFDRMEQDVDGPAPESLEPDQGPPPSPDKEFRHPLIQEFFERCCHADQVILTATSSYYSPTSGAVDMPDDVRECICKELKTNANNLRVRRLRLLNELRKFIVETYNLTGKQT